MVDAAIPNVTGLLMALPEIYRERKDARERKESLADLDINDNDSLARAARQLIQTGNPDSMKLGLQLDQMVRANREQEFGMNIARDNANFIGQATGAEPAPTIEGPYPVRPPSPGIRADSSQTPFVGSNPSMARPSARMPSPEVMPSSRVWGDREAEAAGLYEPSPRVAQAPEPPTQSELPMKQRQRELSPPSPEERALEGRLNQAMRQQARNDAAKRPSKALDAYITDLQKQREAFQKQRLDDRSGERKSELDIYTSGIKGDVEDFRKEDTDIRQKAMNAQQTLLHSTEIRDILESGKTDTGPTAEVQERIFGRLIDMGNTLQRLGIIKNPNEFETIRNMKDFNAGLERLATLQVETVFSRLGGFGKNITDQDRNEMYKTVINLKGTLEGNILTTKIGEKIAESQIELAEKVNAYKERQQRAQEPVSTTALTNIRNMHERQFGKELTAFVRQEKARIIKEGVQRPSWGPGIKNDAERVKNTLNQVTDEGARMLGQAVDAVQQRFGLSPPVPMPQPRPDNFDQRFRGGQ